MFAPHLAEFGIVQQQVRQLAALLHQVERRHSGDFALVFARRNAQ